MSWKRIGAYEKRQEIGRGTYGTVYLGVHATTRARVAVKKVLGRTATAGAHEAALLKRCQGAAHVVQLLDVVERNGKTYLILEFMESDLESVIKGDPDAAAAAEASQHQEEDGPPPTIAARPMDVPFVKTYLRMLLEGVAELHALGIMHRDLKPNNVLLSKDQCVAKISDFGMATLVEQKQDKDDKASDAKDRARSIQVVTRAYRAPELFFGDAAYGFGVDMWSVGCVFAEMLLGRVFCDGTSDIDQLSQIFAALGSPLENGWEEAVMLPFYLRFKETKPKPLKEQFPSLSVLGVDLLGQLLALDPKKRISAQQALQHEWFNEAPAPAPVSELRIQEPPEKLVVKRKRTVAEVFAEREIELAERSESNGFVIKGRRLL